jgi:threonine dehydratase
MVSFEDIAKAHERIKAHAKRTPVLTSATVDSLTGASVFFKCENFQRMGAFKFRGAYNALSQLPEDRRKNGVIAFSSGNHAQAVALAGKILGIKALIVMPEDAPKVKLDATRGYGAEIVQYTKNQSRDEVAGKLAAERNLTLIPPFDHEHVIAGQGTAGKELLEDAGPLDLLLVPCGGGGLLSGCAIAAKHLAPKIRVYGVGRRRDAVVREEAPGDHRHSRHHRRRRAHALARQAHLPDRAALRRRHDHRDRRGARARDVLPVGAHEDRGGADRRPGLYCFIH